jgi:hypothetical protein
MKSWLLGMTVAASILVPPTLGCGNVAAQPPAPRQERVAFAKGASSATIKGQVKGDETVDYVVGASAGQTITVTLKPSNPSNYFNVLPPDNQDVAMYAGQTGDPYTGMLPADGVYKVRVYLMRNAARRSAVSTFTLTVGITGKALAPLPAKLDATVAGTPYHATAQVACAPMPYGDTTPKKCDAGVIRRGSDGTATVEISLGTAGKRRILFVAGKPVASDSMEKMTSTRQGDETTVTFESGEYHQIPDALVIGG